MARWLFWIIAAVLIVGYTQSPTFKNGADEIIGKIKEKVSQEIDENNAQQENQIIGNKIELGKIKTEIEISCDSNEICVNYYQEENAFCENGTCFKNS